MFNRIAGTALIVSIIIQFLLWRKRKIPTFFIDLDAAPEERWREVAERFAENTRMAYEVYISAVMRTNNITIDKVHDLSNELGSHFPKEYRREIAGYAKYSKLNKTVIYFLHLHYEFSTTCTTIVCVDEDNAVWVFRSFDYFHKNIVQDLIFNADFQKSNRSIYKATMISGVIGLHNAIRRDRFSISFNRRLAGGTFQDNIAMARYQMTSLGKAWPAILVLRQMMEKEIRYGELIEELETIPLIAPCHFIVAGVNNNEGTIISRGRNDVVKQRTLDIDRGQWYLLITNEDYGSELWKKNGWRYHKVDKEMAQMTQKGVSVESGFKALKVTKWKKSVFLTVMSVDSYLMTSELI